jgi:hypothetical protein
VPAPLAPLLGFLLGVAFAWCSREDLQKTGIASRSLLVVSLFSLLVFAPISAYFLALAPDWSYAYIVDSQKLPGVVDLSLVLFDAASVPAGFVAALRAARAKRAAVLLRLASPPSLLLLAFVLIAFPRLAKNATYAQYHGDFGIRSVAGSPLGYAMLWMALVLVGAVAWTGSWLWKNAHHARRD